MKEKIKSGEILELEFDNCIKKELKESSNNKYESLKDELKEWRIE